jgi:hypothetical protein
VASYGVHGDGTLRSPAYVTFTVSGGRPYDLAELLVILPPTIRLVAESLGYKMTDANPVLSRADLELVFLQLCEDKSWRPRKFAD